MQCIKNNQLVIGITIILCVGFLIAFLRLFYLPIALTNSDALSMIETARLFSGENAMIHGERILKPLQPILLVVLKPIFGNYFGAFFFQSVFFYLATLLAFYGLLYAFFQKNERAVVGTLIFATSYPLVKYGVDFYAESGAIFLYVLSLYFSFLFLQNPTRDRFWINTVLITIGFFWKEYSIVNVVIFNLIILLHTDITRQKKYLYFFLFNSFFGSIHALWQIFVYTTFQYSYFDWFNINQGDSGSIKAQEFTLYNFGKSMFALLGFSWFFAVYGITKWKELTSSQKQFLLFTALPPFMAFLWGWVSSRLFFVIAPMFSVLSIHGILSIRFFQKRLFFFLLSTALAIMNLSFVFILA